MFSVILMSHKFYGTKIVLSADHFAGGGGDQDPGHRKHKGSSHINPVEHISMMPGLVMSKLDEISQIRYILVHQLNQTSDFCIGQLFMKN